MLVTFTIDRMTRLQEFIVAWLRFVLPDDCRTSQENSRNTSLGCVTLPAGFEEYCNFSLFVLLHTEYWKRGSALMLKTKISLMTELLQNIHCIIRSLLDSWTNDLGRVLNAYTLNKSFCDFYKKTSVFSLLEQGHSPIYTPNWIEQQFCIMPYLYLLSLAGERRTGYRNGVIQVPFTWLNLNEIKKIFRISYCF